MLKNIRIAKNSSKSGSTDSTSRTHKGTVVVTDAFSRKRQSDHRKLVAKILDLQSQQLEG